MSRTYLTAVVCLVLVGGVPSAEAVSIKYDFSDTTDGPLNGQDNWVAAGGGTNNQSASGAAGWMGQYAQAGGGDSQSSRPNSVSLPDDVSFDVSTEVAVYGNDFYARGGILGEIITGVNRSSLYWSVNGAQFNLAHGVPESGGVSSIFTVGVDVTALGAGNYSAQRYYQNNTASGPVTNVGAPILFSETPSSWDSLYLRMHNDGGILHSSRLDNISISPAIPEPSTLALAGLGLMCVFGRRSPRVRR